MNLSASTYSKFRTCPRLYYWECVIGLRLARDDGARRFGTMYHAGQEAWWRVMDGGDVPWRDKDSALVAALQAIADNARHIRTDPFEVAKAEAMMVAYHARYFELDFVTHEGTPESSVEIWFDIPMRDERQRQINGWRVIGRMDALKRFFARPKVVEHKTTQSEIHGASDYWSRLAFDVQSSLYIDAARFRHVDTHEALYDVSRKPQQRALLATPEEKRRMTKGKGCTYCGGRAGGKLGVAQGTGKIRIMTKVDGDGLLLPKPTEVETTCTACAGSGWKLGDEPRLAENQRLEDETVDAHRARVAEELAADPDAYFRQGTLVRGDEALAEMRADVVVTAGEIGALVEWGRRATPSGELSTVEARRCFPRNTGACTNIYGRRCDFLDVCSGAVNPYDSNLYTLRRSRTETPRELHHFDTKGREVAKQVGGVEEIHDA